MTRMLHNTPTRKVAAGSLGSAVTVLLLWGLEEVFQLKVPEGLHWAVVLVVTFAVGYFVPPAATDQIVTEDPVP